MKMQRVNTNLEVAVNRGIAALLIFGIREGIKVMRDNHVPIEIAKRIILGPNTRRASDWRH